MTLGESNTLVIRTPEGISFPLVLAGPVVRFFAWGIDFACIVAATMLLTPPLFMLGILSPDLASAAGTVMYFAISIGYGILTEWFWRGQTLGKRLLGLRVMDAEGLHLAFSQIAIRNLLRFVDALPLFYLVGGVACVLTARVQRLGDYAANTIVIRNRPGLEYDLQQIAPGKYNSLRDYPHLEARLRQRASSGEAALAIQALLRREELEPIARVELFRDIAAHFKSLIAFPEEAILGMTDEQYVRNIVDCLTRHGA